MMWKVDAVKEMMTTNQPNKGNSNHDSAKEETCQHQCLERLGARWR
jgi:hypothetical protein